MDKLDKITNEFLKKGELSNAFGKPEDIVATFDYYVLSNGRIKTFSGLLESFSEETKNIPEDVKVIDYFEREKSRVVIKFYDGEEMKTIKIPVIHHIRTSIDLEGLVSMFIDRRKM